MGKITVFRPLPDQYPISSPFGVTRTLKLADGSTMTRVHHGIDFACPIGTPIRAMWDGAVRVTGWENLDNHLQGLGYRIWTDIVVDDKRYFAWYGHLSKIMVDPLDDIKMGQVIALSGSTGDATGPHLHVQFREVDTSEFYDADFLEMPETPVA